MNLREWLYLKKITITRFAKEMNITRDHLSNIINGHYAAGERLAKDITSATNHEVQSHEFADPKEEK